MVKAAASRSSDMENLNQIATNLFFILGSEVLAFAIGVILAPQIIKLLRHYKMGKQLRENASSGEKAAIFNELHAKKKGTPTMGGIMIWGTVILVVGFSRVLSAFGIFEHSLLNRKETWLPLFTLLTTAILGLVDDYLNIKGEGKSKGLNMRPKFLWMTLLAGLGAYWFYYKLGYNSVHIPGIGDLMIGAWYIPLFMLVFLSTSNAVNFTDGLDGLAGGLLIIAFSVFGVIAAVKGLFILAALCAVIAGALIAFLWFNTPPAQVYMGDTGAIALGATLGVIAMMTDSIVPLILIGFIFVIETLSVIIQLTSKKLFKRKVFAIAPIHHHFEYKGWSESTVVMRFWIIGGFIAGFGLVMALIS